MPPLPSPFAGVRVALAGMLALAGLLALPLLSLDGLARARALPWALLACGAGGALLLATARRAARLKEAEAALARECETRFRAVVDYTAGVEAWFGTDGHLRWINRAIERLTGYGVDECLAHADFIDLLVYQKDRRPARDAAALAESEGEAKRELRLRCKDGALLRVALTWQICHDSAGQRLGLRLSVENIQGRKEAELKQIDIVAQLRREQGLKEFYLDRAHQERARLSALLDAIDVGVMFADRSHHIVYCNKLFNATLALPEDERLEGQRDSVLLERTRTLRVDDAAYSAHIAAALATRQPSPPFDVALQDGRIIAESSALVPGDTPDEILGRIWIYRDVTELRRNAERLEQLATRDPLTGAYNRRRFHEDLERMMADAGRRHARVGLIVIDLDGFKPINDAFGHQAGDTTLIRLAGLIGRAIRRNEAFFRLGGDEFAILAADSDAESAEGLARRIGTTIAEQCFEFDGGEARLTASLGIALYPDHAADADALVAAADRAMYVAKATGKNAWRLATPLKPH